MDPRGIAKKLAGMRCSKLTWCPAETYSTGQRIKNGGNMISTLSIKLVASTSLFFSLLAGAAIRTYQVTGPIVEVNNTSIVVQKGKERWEIARDAATKVMGELKVGNKVTVEYKMAATMLEAK